MSILKNFVNPWESTGELGSQALGTEALEGNILNDNNKKEQKFYKNDYFNIRGDYLGSDGNDSQIKIIETYNNSQPLKNQKSNRYGTFSLTPEVHGLIAKYYLNQLKGRIIRSKGGTEIKIQYIPALGLTNIATELMGTGRLDGLSPVPMQAEYLYNYGSDFGIQIAIKDDGTLVREMMDNVNFYKSIIIHECFHFAVDFYYSGNSYFNYPKSMIESGWNHLNHYLIQTYTPEFQAINDKNILRFHYGTIYSIWLKTAQAANSVIQKLTDTSLIKKMEKDIKFYFNEYVFDVIPEEYKRKLNIRSRYEY